MGDVSLGDPTSGNCGFHLIPGVAVGRHGAIDNCGLVHEVDLPDDSAAQGWLAAEIHQILADEQRLAVGELTAWGCRIAWAKGAQCQPARTDFAAHVVPLFLIHGGWTFDHLEDRSPGR